MKLVNYLFTNTFSITSFFWKSTLIMCGGGILCLILGSLLIKQKITNDQISGLLNQPEIITQIDNITTLLTGDQYIQISSASGFITNKTGIWFENNNIILDVQLDNNCEDWFTTTHKKGALITNTSVCFRDTNKQQIVTWIQIMSGITQQTLQQSALFTTYPSLQQIISGDTITLNQSGLEAIVSNGKSMLQNPSVINSITAGTKSVINLLLIPLGISIILIIGIVRVMFIIGLSIYSLIIRAVSGIMQYPINLDKAYSISRLPYIVIELLGIGGGYHRSLRLIGWLFLSIILTYYYHKKTHE